MRRMVDNRLLHSTAIATLDAFRAWLARRAWGIVWPCLRLSTGHAFGSASATMFAVMRLPTSANSLPPWFYRFSLEPRYIIGFEDMVP